MARPARGERNAATVHEMSPEARAQYERVKSDGGVKGWSKSYDPWAWSNSSANDAWPGRETSNPGIWPPEPKEAS